MSGVVGSMPSLTRSGLPAASCSSSIPAGSTSTALRVRSATVPNARLPPPLGGPSPPSREPLDGGPRTKAPPAGWRSYAASAADSAREAHQAAAEEAAHPLRAARALGARLGLDGLRDDGGGLPGSAGDLQLRPVQGIEEQRGL